MLRARSLCFTHRLTGERACVHAGPEEEFDQIVKQLDLEAKSDRRITPTSYWETAGTAVLGGSPNP